MPGIWDYAVAETPIAVIDFETTGICAGPDRVVEAAIVRVEPDGETNVVFDSLIRPGRRVGATFIHGITDADVSDAPTFSEVAGQFVEALSGCVVAAFNAGFDLSFLRAEFASAGIQYTPPHLCLMYLRPHLGLGRVRNLGITCRELGVRLSAAHSAAGDAFASALLWKHYRSVIDRRQWATFRDLAGKSRCQFVRSFDRDLASADLADGLGRGTTKARGCRVPAWS